jgi:hypothetical protein
LKKQLSATKLLVTGLDKGIADFKKKFDVHSHSFSFGIIPIGELAKQPKDLGVLVTKAEMGIFYSKTP